MDVNKRIKWVDYTKAFACFLVVLGHLIQSLSSASIDNFDNITYTINKIIYMFHMPLFMCLSGYLYSKKKINTISEYKEFEKKKIINLIIPYITFYLLYFFLNIIFSNNVNHPKKIDELLGIINNPMAPYWFLYSILFIFIITPVLEWLCKYNKKCVFIVFGILKFLSIYMNTNIYFIDTVMKWGIYFYFGVFIKEEIKIKSIILYLLTLLYIGLAIIFAINYSKLQDVVVEILKIPFGIIGTFLCIELFKKVNKSIILDTFKKYTFQIFLIHTICAAPFRILLLKLGINNYFIQLIAGLITSIYLPVLIAIICDKTKYLNFFFYPLKTVSDIKSSKEVMKAY